MVQTIRRSEDAAKVGDNEKPMSIIQRECHYSHLSGENEAREWSKREGEALLPEKMMRNKSNSSPWIKYVADHGTMRRGEVAAASEERGEAEEYVMNSIPSKVSVVKSRHLLHHTWIPTYDQMRTFAKTFCWTLLVLLLAISRSCVSGQELEINQDDGVCPIKCACLDSYVQCTKLNLEIAPGRVPKWAEFL